jgi:transposase InsO family protein
MRQSAWSRRHNAIFSAVVKLYLCAVRDGCSRRVIGWAVDDHMHTDLVESALTMAVAMRGELAETVILHADQGCEYPSAQIARIALGAQSGALGRRHRRVLG